MLSMGEESDGILRSTVQFLTEFVNVLGKAAQGVLGLDVAESIANHLEGFSDLLGEEKAAEIEKYTKRTKELKSEILDLEGKLKSIDDIPWWKRKPEDTYLGAEYKKDIKSLNGELEILGGVLDVVGPKTETEGERINKFKNRI